jgi:hypothetical protein
MNQVQAERDHGNYYCKDKNNSIIIIIINKQEGRKKKEAKQ